MTIGIAVSGPRAGLAAYRALRAVECLGRGAIGGFVSFVAITGDRLATAECQRGGALALFGGGEPPQEIADARLAGLMSSGPDRPEPLIQFTPADPHVGILTGHRLPNMPPPDGGAPPNLAALKRLSAGSDPVTAVRETLAAAPDADAGLIAMDIHGVIALGNSDLVARRDDLGQALVSDAATALRIGLLHNSIFPVAGLAAAAVAAAIDAVAPADRAEVNGPVVGVPLRPGSDRAMHVDANGLTLSFSYPEDTIVGPDWEGSAVLRGDPVKCDGRVIGRVVREVYCITRNQVVTAGRGGVEIGWRKIAERPAE